MSWLKLIAILPLLYTLVKNTVEVVEDVAADGDIDGPEKKESALDAVKKGLESFGYGSLWGIARPIVDSLIDATVAIYNAFRWKRNKDLPVVEGPSTDGTTP